MNRVRNRLKALDHLDAPNVWPRAQSLTPGPAADVEVSYGRESRRVMAGLVAFALFFAAGAFAIRALQPRTDQPLTTGTEVDGTILWPERTGERLAASQARIDAGDADLGWRRDPEAVAARFAEDVLGWGPPGGSYRVVVNDSPGALGDAVGITLERLPVPCPLPPSDANGPSSCPPPYENERLTLRQAGVVGNQGIWSVTEVRAAVYDLDLDAGERLLNGDFVFGSVAFPPTADPANGFTAQYGFTVGTDPDCASGSTIGMPRVEDQHISFESSVGRGGWRLEGCDSAVPGFAYVATGSMPPCPKGVLGCPLVVLVSSDLRSNAETLYGLTAVPMVLSIFDGASTPSPEATSGLARAVSVVCATSGTQVTTPTAVGDRGLTFEVDNPGGFDEVIIAGTSGETATQEADIDLSSAHEHTFAELAPGEYVLGCFSLRHIPRGSPETVAKATGMQPFEVLDADGSYVSPRLQCDAEGHAETHGFMVLRNGMDDVTAARAGLVGLRPDDVFEPSGYVALIDKDGLGTYRIVRDGNVLGNLHLLGEVNFGKPALSGFLESCQSSGLGFEPVS